MFVSVRVLLVWLNLNTKMLNKLIIDFEMLNCNKLVARVRIVLFSFVFVFLFHFKMNISYAKLKSFNCCLLLVIRN